MEIQHGIKEFLIEIEVRKYTPRTIRRYRNNLNLFLRFCTEHEIAAIENVTLATVKQFTRAMTASKKKGTYINGILKGVKSFLQYCYEEGYGAFNTKSREYPNHPDLFEQLAGQGRYRDSQKQKRFDVTGIRIPKKIKLHKHHIKYGLRDIL